MLDTLLRGEVVATQTQRIPGRSVLVASCVCIVLAACLGACGGGWAVLAVYQWHL